ncbi:unnamed protein product [Caenorhabditis angaria]|uniref:Uncharacterized protein n=1 Tax=Caenorhabditis angaria TaxID=860376 RepID=A0A9P1IJ42_9PELO|nr:unnamed protein product [Caenorhabditis angaria]
MVHQNWIILHIAWNCDWYDGQIVRISNQFAVTRMLRFGQLSFVEESVQDCQRIGQKSVEQFLEEKKDNKDSIIWGIREDNLKFWAPIDQNGTHWKIEVLDLAGNQQNGPPLDNRSIGFGCQTTTAPHWKIEVLDLAANQQYGPIGQITLAIWLAINKTAPIGKSKYWIWLPNNNCAPIGKSKYWIWLPINNTAPLDKSHWRFGWQSTKRHPLENRSIGFEKLIFLITKFNFLFQAGNQQNGTHWKIEVLDLAAKQQLRPIGKSKYWIWLPINNTAPLDKSHWRFGWQSTKRHPLENRSIGFGCQTTTAPPLENRSIGFGCQSTKRHPLENRSIGFGCQTTTAPHWKIEVLDLAANQQYGPLDKSHWRFGCQSTIRPIGQITLAIWLPINNTAPHWTIEVLDLAANQQNGSHWTNHIGDLAANQQNGPIGQITLAIWLPINKTAPLDKSHWRFGCQSTKRPPLDNRSIGFGCQSTKRHPLENRSIGFGCQSTKRHPLENRSIGFGCQSTKRPPLENRSIGFGKLAINKTAPHWTIEVLDLAANQQNGPIGQFTLAIWLPINKTAPHWTIEVLDLAANQQNGPHWTIEVLDLAGNQQYGPIGQFTLAIWLPINKTAPLDKSHWRFGWQSTIRPHWTNHIGDLGTNRSKRPPLDNRSIGFGHQSIKTAPIGQSKYWIWAPIDQNGPHWTIEVLDLAGNQQNGPHWTIEVLDLIESTTKFKSPGGLKDGRFSSNFAENPSTRRFWNSYLIVL